mgnify:CR=1 FL=1|tara:strand:- start:49 stop:828 length:780 start_codon:yes stop_codon:yes gene_type:complete
MAPIMSIAGLGGPQPSFAKGGGGEASFAWKYHMYGSEMGTLLMYWMTSDGGSEVDDGTLTRITGDDYQANGSAAPSDQIAGQQQTDDDVSTVAGAWRDASIDLSDFFGKTGRVVFLYIKVPGSTNNNSGYRGDIGLDNMAITINGTTTDLNEGTSNATSTLWWTVPSYGLSYSSVANCVSTFEGGTINWVRVVDIATNNDGGAFLKHDGDTGSSTTGPSQSARGDAGYYYIYAETTANQGLSNRANKYTFLVSNEFTLS